MKQITFVKEEYVEKIIDGKKLLVCTNEYKVGLFELLDIAINKLSEKKCDKKEHKITKRLKKKLKTISRFKDEDADSRILLPRDCIIIVEEDEYSILKEHLESATPRITARASELIDDLWTLIDSAPDYIPKPELVKETSPTESEGAE